MQDTSQFSEGEQAQVSLPRASVMLPLSPVRVTYVFIAINVLIFVADAVTQKALLLWGAIIPEYIVLYGQYWRMVTAGFLHFDLTHIIFNMWALYVLGSDVERLYGGARFSLGYGISIVAASLLMSALQPLMSIGAGASGGVMGIAGLLIVYFYRYRTQLHARQEFHSLIRMVGINLAIGLLPGISLWGHLGGFLGGVAAGLLLCPRYTFTQNLEGTGIEMRIQPLSGQQWALLGALLALFPALLEMLVLFR